MSIFGQKRLWVKTDKTEWRIVEDRPNYLVKNYFREYEDLETGDKKWEVCPTFGTPLIIRKSDCKVMEQ